MNKSASPSTIFSPPILPQEPFLLSFPLISTSPLLLAHSLALSSLHISTKTIQTPIHHKVSPLLSLLMVSQMLLLLSRSLHSLSKWNHPQDMQAYLKVSQLGQTLYPHHLTRRSNLMMHIKVSKPCLDFLFLNYPESKSTLTSKSIPFSHNLQPLLLMLP